MSFTHEPATHPQQRPAAGRTATSGHTDELPVVDGPQPQAGQYPQAPVVGQPVTGKSEGKVLTTRNTLIAGGIGVAAAFALLGFGAGYVAGDGGSSGGGPGMSQNGGGPGGNMQGGNMQGGNMQGGGQTGSQNGMQGGMNGMPGQNGMGGGPGGMQGGIPGQNQTGQNQTGQSQTGQNQTGQTGQDATGSGA
jgi:hypothetical protein